MENGWERIHLVGSARPPAFPGVPAVARENSVEFPSEFRAQVEERLRLSGWHRHGRDSWGDTAAPEGVYEEAEADVDVDVDEVLGIVAELDPDPPRVAALGKKVDLARDVEELEKEAFNMMEHREKVLEKLGDEGAKRFSDVLSTGLHRHLKKYRDDISVARRNLDSTFKNFLGLVARAKAEEVLNSALDKMLRDLQETADDSITLSLDRLQAVGFQVSREEFVREMGAKIRQTKERVVTEGSRSHGSRQTGTASQNATVEGVMVAERDLESAIAGLKMVTTGQDDVLDRAKQELESIAGLAWVDEVQVENNALVISTKTAQVPYKYKTTQEANAQEETRVVPIGRFKIAIRLDDDSGGIKIMNLTYSGRGNYQHPHVSGSVSQSICWGNARQGMLKLIQDWDFVTLATLIWNFLNSYNSGDSYAKMGRLWVEWTGEELPGHEIFRNLR